MLRTFFNSISSHSSKRFQTLSLSHSIHSSKKRKVIIVGGGHNGLVCSAYLAKAGVDCLVLERRHIIGGAAVTEGNKDLFISLFPFSRDLQTTYCIHNIESTSLLSSTVLY